MDIERHSYSERCSIKEHSDGEEDWRVRLHYSQDFQPLKRQKSCQRHEANRNEGVAPRLGYPKSVMVVAEIAANGKTPQIFEEGAIKIHSKNYLEDILKK